MSTIVAIDISSDRDGPCGEDGLHDEADADGGEQAEAGADPDVLGFVGVAEAARLPWA